MLFTPFPPVHRFKSPRQFCSWIRSHRSGISFMLAFYIILVTACNKLPVGHLHPPAVGLLLLQEYGIHLCKCGMIFIETRPFGQRGFRFGPAPAVYKIPDHLCHLLCRQVMNVEIWIIPIQAHRMQMRAHARITGKCTRLFTGQSIRALAVCRRIAVFDGANIKTEQVGFA